MDATEIQKIADLAREHPDVFRAMQKMTVLKVSEKSTLVFECEGFIPPVGSENFKESLDDAFSPIKCVVLEGGVTLAGAVEKA